MYCEYSIAASMIAPFLNKCSSRWFPTTQSAVWPKRGTDFLTYELIFDTNPRVTILSQEQARALVDGFQDLFRYLDLSFLTGLLICFMPLCHNCAKTLVSRVCLRRGPFTIKHIRFAWDIYSISPRLCKTLLRPLLPQIFMIGIQIRDLAFCWYWNVRWCNAIAA